MPFRVQDHLDELADPVVFLEPRATVEIVQTHCSVVCLVGDRAYKFKKSVELPFLDFTDPGERARLCHDEVRLNRRLAPATYLGVFVLHRTGDGLRCEPAAPDLRGTPLDHAVVMRRLPADQMLDVQLDEDRVDVDALLGLADRLAAFHRGAAAEADAAVRSAGGPDRLIPELRANFDTLPGLHAPLVDALRSFESAGLGSLHERLASRAAAGKVVEGHGDLHARNICMTDPPTVYDCLEFRFDLRCGDVAGEVGFLAMDLAARGAHDLARRFVSRYVAASGDDDLRDVLPALIRYRALVRAKVDAIAAGEDELDDDARAEHLGSAARHLRLAACSAVEALAPGLVLLASGLPASGKSTVFDRLREESGWPRHSSDLLRADRFGTGAAAYTAEASAAVYRTLSERAAAADGPLLLDANYRTRSARAAVRDACPDRQVVTIRFDCREDTARDRLAARAGTDQERRFHSEADRAVRARLAQDYEPADPQHEPTVVVSTDEGGEVLDPLLARLLGVLGATNRTR